MFQKMLQGGSSDLNSITEEVHLYNRGSGTSSTGTLEYNLKGRFTKAIINHQIDQAWYPNCNLSYIKDDVSTPFTSNTSSSLLVIDITNVNTFKLDFYISNQGARLLSGYISFV